MGNLRIAAGILLAGGLVLGLSGCDKLRARNHLNEGVAAFKAAKYTEAVEHFKQTEALDPDNTNGTLFLATAYMAQWIPGADSPQNLEFAAKAHQAFEKVLQKDPNEKTALEYLGSLSFNQAQSLPSDQKGARYDESITWFKRLIGADAQNKEAYYYLGVIAYQKYHPALMLARTSLHMKDDEGPIKDKKVRDDLAAQYTGIIDDGISNLHKALDIDKEYDDAMAYLNLLIRQKADLLDNQDEYKKQIDEADSWLQKTLDTKKAKAARQPTNGGGITMDQK
jgi:tetratricopeptide (TPR) repeat protein